MSTLANKQIDFSLPYKVADISLAEWGRKKSALLKPKCPD